MLQRIKRLFEGGNPSTEIKKILIYRCGTIGDTIVAIPAINSVRARYPNAEISLMTAIGDGKLWANEVVKDFGWFGEMVTYPEGKIWYPSVALPLVKRLRNMNVDLVLDLASDKNSGLRALRDRVFFRLAGIRKFVIAKSEKVSFFGKLNRTVRVYEQEVDRFLKTVAEHSIAGQAPRFDLPISDANRTRIDKLLRKHRVAPDAILVGLCPGSKQQAKRWPLDRYQEIGQRLIDAGAVIVTVGGVEESSIGKRIAAYWPKDRWANLAGELSVLESAELLRRCAFYLGNDTGPMHLAAAVGTPCIALFSAREPIGSWYPYGEDHVVFRKEVACQNCFLSTCYIEGVRCMREISVDEVWEAAQRFLRSRAA